MFRPICGMFGQNFRLQARDWFLKVEKPNSNFKTLSTLLFATNQIWIFFSDLCVQTSPTYLHWCCGNNVVVSKYSMYAGDIAFQHGSMRNGDCLEIECRAVSEAKDILESHFQPPPKVAWIRFATITFHVGFFCLFFCFPSFIKAIRILEKEIVL